MANKKTFRYFVRHHTGAVESIIAQYKPIGVSTSWIFTREAGGPAIWAKQRGKDIGIVWVGKNGNVWLVVWGCAWYVGRIDTPCDKWDGMTDLSPYRGEISLYERKSVLLWFKKELDCLYARMEKEGWPVPTIDRKMIARRELS